MNDLGKSNQVTDASEAAYRAKGTSAAWYKGWDLTREERERFRQTTIASQAAKARAISGDCKLPKYPIPTPRMKTEDLMPVRPRNGIRALSLFSGGGGLDIGFDRAGFEHVASFEMREDAAAAIRAAHTDWAVFGGPEGDVCNIDWRRYAGSVDVLHGGPPCQPFSHAGYQSGSADVRDMFPQLVRAVKAVKPRAFVAENVPGLTARKFRTYIDKVIFEPLKRSYVISMFVLEAASFGVPQRRRRVWFVGFRDRTDAARFSEPEPTHADRTQEAPMLPLGDSLPDTPCARYALGLDDIGYDALAPTLRSGFTGPRHTTSVVNSVTAMKQWTDLRIWPNGVAETREKASAFVARHNHFRLSIPDCMLLQGFPSDWPLTGPVYKALGMIGNSVAPPMGYHVAAAVARALGAD